jgi:predicted small metal-binding protein
MRRRLALAYNAFLEVLNMTKVVRCREVGVDCDFEARGETEQEVLQKCAEHAKSAHQMDEIPPELASKVRSAIHDE